MIINNYILFISICKFMNYSIYYVLATHHHSLKFELKNKFQL